MRILYPHQIEVLLPIRTFFLQWRRTIANLDPPRRLIRAKSRVVHVPQVLAFRDGALAKTFVFNGLQQIPFATGFNAGSNKITHNSAPKRVAPDAFVRDCAR